jgi:DNA-binding transcriptional MerR regulator
MSMMSSSPRSRPTTAWSKAVASRHTRMATEPIDLPDKLTFRLREVIQVTKLDARVLEFWEKEFGAFQPVVNQSGETFYSHHDLELIVRIKQWLINEKRSKDQVKELLQQQGSEPPLPSAKGQSKGSGANRKKLQKVRASLAELLTILDKHDKTKS